MALRKIRIDDEVMVLVGKDRGKLGTVQRLLSDGRAIVSGIQMVKKHVRPNPQIGQQGGIVSQEAPVQVSNLALVHPKTGKAARVGFKEDENGRRHRVFRDGTPVESPKKGK
ncbi:MAG: 50S ribosomal protein L24 [Gammaproteobacteria bacterium]